MPRFFAWADALLVHLKDDPLFAITIPAKTMAYLACGRPIIGALTGDGADVVRAASAGPICPPEDASALAKAIKTLYTTPLAEREALGAAGRRYYLENFARRLSVDRYESLFERAKRH
jgi:colanic acid biosynthesis glycosyl transferase WcaI